jgi:class 3 adenylate cyclase
VRSLDTLHTSPTSLRLIGLGTEEHLDLTAFDINAMIACGMGAAFWLTDRATPTSRALVIYLLALGGAILANSHLEARIDLAAPQPWSRLMGLPETIACLAGGEWGLRVGRTLAKPDQVRSGTYMMRTAQGLVLRYGLLTMLYPGLRATAFVEAISIRKTPEPAFYLFAAPMLLAGMLAALAALRVLKQRPDPAEATRIVAMMVAMPILASSLILPRSAGPYLLAGGQMVFMAGALRYYILQGARAQFLGRFLAPQVAELVRVHGLPQAMRPQRLTVAVVCCDIRGFTAHAHDRPPEEVLRLLRNYYEEVGKLVAEHGGTIKDLAGDGVLIVLGAPLPCDNPARQALALARDLITRLSPLLAADRLACGVGISTGEIAVGVIGEGARLEYAAVGPAVNLAARLCAAARAGEIRTDDATLSAAGETATTRVLEQVKGWPEPVPVNIFAVAEPPVLRPQTAPAA